MEFPSQEGFNHNAFDPIEIQIFLVCIILIFCFNKYNIVNMIKFRVCVKEITALLTAVTL